MDVFLRSIYPDWGYVMVHLQDVFEPVFSQTLWAKVMGDFFPELELLRSSCVSLYPLFPFALLPRNYLLKAAEPDYARSLDP